MSIAKLDQIIDKAKEKGLKRLVVAYANDEHSIEAVYDAAQIGLVKPILIGDRQIITQICEKLNFDLKVFDIVDEKDEMKCGYLAVEMINKGEADVLMKGLLSTDKYMRVILDKDKGLLPPKAILSHVTVLEIPTYHKLLIVGDVAIIPAPDLQQKIVITGYLIDVAHKLGIENPKVALIAATEQMSIGMQACVDAAIISKMGDRKQIKGAQIDGPLALDVAIDKESVQIKKLDSPVAGDADVLVFPNIEAGNVFFKTCTKFIHAELAAVVIGAKAPAVLTSRGDSARTKTYSIALASLLAV
ncbi:MAG: bifunctional enoyl-CoA hydratase/phosphate acetyltransferase [Bacteroidales bacterium]|nr:bifunctional enoyl-CoA hydratase/phosphate acetyltransferase [Bacteroidales bacterium]